MMYPEYIPPMCKRCEAQTSQSERDLCDPCRLLIASEQLDRFLAHHGVCWQRLTEPGALGAGCNDLRRLMRTLGVPRKREVADKEHLDHVVLGYGRMMTERTIGQHLTTLQTAATSHGLSPQLSREIEAVAEELERLSEGSPDAD